MQRKVKDDIKIIFITGILPKNGIDKIISNSKVPIQFAADILQRNFIKGISKYFSNLTIINFPFLGGFPFSYKNCFIPNSSDIIDGKPFLSYGFINLNYLKHFIIEEKIKKELKKQNSFNSENVFLIVYSGYAPFLKSALNFKKNNPNAKLISIIPDLPSFINVPNEFYKKFFWKYSKEVFKKSMTHFDGFVFISKYMAELDIFQNKEYEIIEGIVDNPIVDLDNSEIRKFGDYILYSGTLAERYGIKVLVEAFILTENKNVKLLICGGGDSENYLKEKQIENEKIVFLGNVSTEKSIYLQRNAKLLINPRQPFGEYTKYSFPSKILEYFSSGRPTLMYKLKGIPEEYYQFCFTVEKNDVQSLALKIDEILSLPDEELTLLGKKSKAFVEEHKNPFVQSQKIKRLIYRIYNGKNK